MTTGEMVIGPKRTLFMDEISTGLDASTTQQIVQCISNLVHFRDVSPADPLNEHTLSNKSRCTGHQTPNITDGTTPSGPSLPSVDSGFRHDSSLPKKHFPILYSSWKIAPSASVLSSVASSREIALLGDSTCTNQVIILISTLVSH